MMRASLVCLLLPLAAGDAELAERIERGARLACVRRPTDLSTGASCARDNVPEGRALLTAAWEEMRDAAGAARAEVGRFLVLASDAEKQHGNPPALEDGARAQMLRDSIEALEAAGGGGRRAGAEDDEHRELELWLRASLGDADAATCGAAADAISAEYGEVRASERARAQDRDARRRARRNRRPRA